MNKPKRIGIVGCGNISPAYFNGCKPYSVIEIVACADMAPEVAAEKAAQFQIPKVYTVDELLADESIDIVVNLTVPKVHAEVNLAGIAAGKNVHCEKPLATNRMDGLRTLEAAEEKGVRVGCAPDTFLGGGIQTCRKLIDDGWIGTPVAATAYFLSVGHERWHPAPDFFYQSGGGPMLDMGPYYLTALVNLLGPIVRVSGSARATFVTRTITHDGPRYGETIPVETPTHLAGTLDFANGAIVTVMMSFDVCSHQLPHIEIYGSEGTLQVPNPNIFGGPVLIRRRDSEEWSEMPHTHSDSVNRGVGVADMAYGLISGRPHRVNGKLACHVLDVMQAFEESSNAGRHVELTTTCERPAPLPMGLLPGILDE